MWKQTMLHRLGCCLLRWQVLHPSWITPRSLNPGTMAAGICVLWTPSSILQERDGVKSRNRANEHFLCFQRQIAVELLRSQFFAQAAGSAASRQAMAHRFVQEPTLALSFLSFHLVGQVGFNNAYPRWKDFATVIWCSLPLMLVCLFYYFSGSRTWALILQDIYCVSSVMLQSTSLKAPLRGWSVRGPEELQRGRQVPASQLRKYFFSTSSWLA